MRIVDYDPRWPTLELARDEILSLAPGLVLAIEHIGSTAVPGLAAKPKIDLDAVLIDEAAVSTLSAKLAVSGFRTHGDPHNDGRLPFTREHEDGLRLYLCTAGNPAHRDRLLFRDHLRYHSQRAAEYAALKRDLAEKANGDWDIYTGGKTDFVAETLRRAAAEQLSRR
ncbi:GrpB family protein [Rhizobium sp. S96]|uniref:GrpB family protein n=1 Tax=Rhizobium sp. S96 TaxID=3055140 RepID=UPI0025AA7F0B|nr:GrpB family protein [Rhizobium sp. S96]MDM9619456.1 GrpB family protein [Rhizobium sp. S96]